MADIDFLKEYVTETAFLELEDIFRQAASDRLSQAEEEELNRRLEYVLKQDTAHCQRIRDISPSGKNYLVISVGGCILVNIFTAILIFDSPLLFEGDVAIRNIRWIEEDRIVLLDACNICYGKTETYICHYSPDQNAFTHYTPYRNASPALWD